MADSLLKQLEALHYQNREGNVDPEIWTGFNNMLDDFAAYTGFQAWWQTRRHWFGNSFRAFVDSHTSADMQPTLYGEDGSAGGRP